MTGFPEILYHPMTDTDIDQEFHGLSPRRTSSASSQAITDLA
jgi:hypothetical protein